MPFESIFTKFQNFHFLLQNQRRTGSTTHMMSNIGKDSNVLIVTHEQRYGHDLLRERNINHNTSRPKVIGYNEMENKEFQNRLRGYHYAVTFDNGFLLSLMRDVTDMVDYFQNAIKKHVLQRLEVQEGLKKLRYHIDGWYLWKSGAPTDRYHLATDIQVINAAILQMETEIFTYNRRAIKSALLSVKMQRTSYKDASEYLAKQRIPKAKVRRIKYGR